MTPFIAVWNYAVAMEWADLRKWIRAKTVKKGTNVEDFGPKRVGSYPVEYDVAWRFIKGCGVANQTIFTIPVLHRTSAHRTLRHEHKPGQRARRWITLPKSKIGEPRGVPVHEALVPMLTDMVTNRPEARPHMG